MGLKPIAREHVELAIKEWKSLGRNEFLRKYNVEPAKHFWVRQDGMDIDGKALLRVAYKFAFPNGQVAGSNDFKGGNEAMRKLRKLGFTEFVYEPPKT